VFRCYLSARKMGLRPVLQVTAMNHRSPAPKGHNEIAQGNAMRRPGYSDTLKNQAYRST
jgi:hypothetical protein